MIQARLQLLLGGHLLLAIGCAGLQTPSPPPSSTRIDEAPMYGGMDRSKVPELKAGDDKFIKDVTAQYGSRERASRVWVNQGFAFYEQDKLGMAMRRFNQAWLLDPTNSEVYWGFAAVLQDQEKYCEALSMTERAFSSGPIQDGFLPDAALIYTGCAVTSSTVSAEVKTAYLKRSDDLFAQANGSPAVTKDYLLFNWARAMYGRGDYAAAWTKVEEYEKVTGKPFNPTFVKNLTAKQPRPR